MKAAAGTSLIGENCSLEDSALSPNCLLLGLSGSPSLDHHTENQTYLGEQTQPLAASLSSSSPSDRP
ncbi:rCG43900, isoform CRA_a [Rattus norvegicus]|uniref:RCG43900, isoform CRA_a n=1 Tax=Rattus norvegicus TaxID=10116 RepID=A6J736_RAT|nr:rCG43900, isoform CRA_a [Rattus norvegicus]